MINAYTQLIYQPLCEVASQVDNNICERKSLNELVGYLKGYFDALQDPEEGPQDILLNLPKGYEPLVRFIYLALDPKQVYINSKDDISYDFELCSALFRFYELEFEFHNKEILILRVPVNSENDTQADFNSDSELNYNFDYDQPQSTGDDEEFSEHDLDSDSYDYICKERELQKVFEGDYEIITSSKE